MADPTLFTTHVTQGLKRLLAQFQGQPNMEGQLRSFLLQVQEVEAMLYSLIVERYLDTAVGAQLDGIGRVVGELRLGKDDIDYRAALQGRIRSNRANSRVEDLHFLFGLLLPGFTFTLIEGTVASFVYIVNETLTPAVDPSATVLDAQLQVAKGAGIGATLIYSNDADIGFRFSYASGDVLEADTDQGYADDASTTGGVYSAVV